MEIKNLLKDIVSNHIIIFIIFFSIVIIIFFPLYNLIQDGAFIITNIMPILFGLLFGMRKGIVYALLHIGLIIFIGNYLDESIENLMYNGVPAAIITMIFTISAGRISDLTKKYRKELIERKAVEKLLSDYKNNLEVIVEQRTSELQKSNNKLKQEMREREKAEAEMKKLQNNLKRAEKMEAVGILAGSVAHDLNNILSGIINYPELLLSNIEESNPIRKHILAIRESGIKASAVVQDLLSLARRGIINTEIININDIILKLLASPEFFNLKTQNYLIKRDLQVDLQNVYGSSVHISNAIMNLILNSYEAINDIGELVITTRNIIIEKPVNKYERIEAGEYATVSVADTGIGIENENLQRIFEPFYTRKVMGKSGTGLGMAIVWGTVKDHNGYIDVESKVGKGTVFTLYFPSTKENITARPANLTLDYLKGSGESILIIDDVDIQRDICTEILTSLNYKVSSVSSGEEALEYLKENDTDLLVLDMIMENGMDGLETYREVIKIHPGQKAVIVSGYTETDLVKEAQELGAGAYIKKPYTLETIGLKVKEELNASSE